MNVHEHDCGECVGMYAVRVDVDGLQTRQPRAVSRGEAAAVLERTVHYKNCVNGALLTHVCSTTRQSHMGARTPCETQLGLMDRREEHARVSSTAMNSN